MTYEAGPVPDLATSEEIRERIERVKSVVKKIIGKGSPMKNVFELTDSTRKSGKAKLKRKNTSA